MNHIYPRLKEGITAGIKKGMSSFIWMVKIVVPLSLVITILQWTGWLNQIDFILTPLMSLVNLPPEAALPIISGMLLNLYATIAIITVVPFTPEQMTLIAVFNLIAHNMIMESMIQHKSGINWAKITAIRIGAAIITVLAISPFLGETSQSVAAATIQAQVPLLDVLKEWFLSLIFLLMKIFGIIMALMITLNTFKSLGWIAVIIRFFRPVGRIFGLQDNTAMLFMPAIIFGLFYGGAVIMEEAEKAGLTSKEVEYLHVSIGINHSMIEDPSLFAVLGLNPFWLWVPKTITAIAAVQLWRLLRLIKSKAFPNFAKQA